MRGRRARRALFGLVSVAVVAVVSVVLIAGVANAGGPVSVGGAPAAVTDFSLTPVLDTPVNGTHTTCVGTLATGTYYYRVAAYDATGQTLASTQTSKAITGPLGVNVTWGAVTGSLGYHVYGRSTGAELYVGSVVGSTSFCDSGSVTPVGSLPASNTTGGAVKSGAYLTAPAFVATSDDPTQPTGISVGAVSPFPSYIPRGLYVANTAPGITLMNTQNTANHRHYDIFANMESAGPVYSRLEVNSANDDGSNVQTLCQFSFYNSSDPPFSCVGAIESGSGFRVSGVGPFDLYNPAAGLNLKTWRMHQKTGDTSRLDFSLMSDDGGTETPWLTAHRNGASILDVVIPASPLYVYGAVNAGTTAPLYNSPQFGAKCSSGVACVSTESASAGGAVQYTQPVDGAGVRWIINSKTGTAAEETFGIYSANGDDYIAKFNGAGNGGNTCMGRACTTSSNVALTVGNGSVTGLQIGAGTAIQLNKRATATIDFASLTLGCADSSAITLTSAAFGCNCSVDVDADWDANAEFSCRVSSSGNVKVRFCATGIATDPASHVFGATVECH